MGHAALCVFSSSGNIAHPRAAAPPTPPLLLEVPVPPSTHALSTPVSRRDLVRIAWPIVVSMLSYTAMSVVGTLFVARLGTAELASMGLALSTLFTIHAFGDGLLTGLKVAVAQRTGAGDEDAVERLLWHGLWLALGMGLVEIALVPFADLFFTLQGASPSATASASGYFGARMLGGPIVFGTYALSAWLQGRGDTRPPMFATVLANLANIALDPLLIFGAGPIPALGTKGAAVATVLSYGLAFTFLAHRLRAPLARFPRRPRRALFADVWRLGAPLGLRSTLHIGSFAVFNAILARVGDHHLAAHVVVVRIISVSFLPGLGIGEAASILVGQLVGAARLGEIVRVRRDALRLGASVMAACGLLFVLFPGPLVHLFGPKPAVAAIALDLMLIAAAFQLFDAVAAVYTGVLNGAGDTRFVMVAGVATQWLVMVPLGWALAVPAGLGAVGAWLGLTAEILAAAALAWWRVHGEPWRRRLPAAAPPPGGPAGA